MKLRIRDVLGVMVLAALVAALPAHGDAPETVPSCCPLDEAARAAEAEMAAVYEADGFNRNREGLEVLP